MPVIMTKAVPVLLALAYMVFSLPGKQMSVKFNTFQNDTLYGYIEFQGQRSPVEVQLLDGNSKAPSVRVVYKKSGKDVTLFYDRATELTDFDRQVVESILTEIGRTPTITDQVREKFSEGLKGLLRQGVAGNPAKKRWGK